MPNTRPGEQLIKSGIYSSEHHNWGAAIDCLDVISDKAEREISFTARDCLWRVALCIRVRVADIDKALNP